MSEEEHIPTSNPGTFGMDTIQRSMGQRNSGGNGLLIFFLAIIIYFIDIFWLKFDGINLVSVFRSGQLMNIFYKGIIINAVFWIILAAIYFIKRPQNKEEFISLILLIAAIFFVASLSGIRSSISLMNLSAVIHILFIIFGIRNGILTKSYDKTTANYYTILIILLDFFLFNLIYSIFPASAMNLNRVIIPLLPLSTLILMNDSRFRSWLLFLITLFYILIVAQTYVASTNFQQNLNQNQIEGAKMQSLSAWDKFKALFTNAQASWNQSMTQINGDYYTGQVEQNQAAPLGVFLEDIKASDTQFLINESVDVWAKLKAQSFENNKNPIAISVVCSTKNSTGQTILGTVSPKGGKFSVASYEDEFLTCNFPKNTFMVAGYYPITFNATFNFDTQSYLKTYYIDKDRKRSLMADGKDIFSEYGITDTNPTAVFTNGPLQIGMETTTPPVGVNQNDDFSSYLGITLDRHWGEGTLMTLNSLYIALPEGTSLDSSCKSFVESSSTEASMVVNDGVKVYKIDNDQMIIDNKKGYTLPKSFKCSIKLDDRNMLLGNTPISIRYFKAKTEYTYSISESTNINVKSDSST